ncbi:MAG: MMPL family transporter, partial [Thermoplasmatales archaeon]|nr:MMPL family transporter [Thermoplasmatales archaeon]
ILLFFVMKSYLTPLRAILTIVMSIVWTLGLTYFLFVDVLATPVYWILPIILFVICLGLGMDYDILLTTRIRENVAKGMSNDDAIVHALESTGAVITICGIIMSSAFGTLMLSSTPMLQQFGFALWFAILVDALLVRTYLVPAVMHLLGRWNWVGPKWLQKGEYDHIHEERE